MFSGKKLLFSVEAYHEAAVLGPSDHYWNPSVSQRHISDVILAGDRPYQLQCFPTVEVDPITTLHVGLQGVLYVVASIAMEFGLQSDWQSQYTETVQEWQGEHVAL